MRLAIISEGFQLWPLYVGHVKGFFPRESLALEITLTGASGRQLEALVRGDFEIGFQQSDHIVRAVERGSDLFIFMATAPQPDLRLMVAPGIREFSDLRGRTIIVDGGRTGYALLLHRLLGERGLTGTDYSVVESGGVRERYDALRAGAGVAAWLNPPFDGWLLAEGYGSLGRFSELFPGYPGSIAAARRTWARANSGSLVAFIRAYDSAYAWLLDPANREEALSIAIARLATDRAQTEGAYLSFTSQPRPQLRADSLRTVIDAVWEGEGYAGSAGAPEKYVDLSYLELARQGSR